MKIVIFPNQPPKPPSFQKAGGFQNQIKARGFQNQIKENIDMDAHHLGICTHCDKAIDDCICDLGELLDKNQILEEKCRFEECDRFADTPAGLCHECDHLFGNEEKM